MSSAHLGGLGGVRNLFFKVDPFSEAVRDAEAFRASNIYMTFVFSGLVCAYSIYAFIMFHQRPVVENFAFTPMGDFGCESLGLELECIGSTNLPRALGCYERENRSDIRKGQPPNVILAAPISRYIELSQTSANGSRVSMNITSPFARAAFEQSSAQVQLCYSDSYSDGVDVDIPDFDGWDNDTEWMRLRVRVSAARRCEPECEAAEARWMNYTIDMEHWQRKTIYLGRKVYEDSSDASIWQQLYIADLFYDGKNAARKAKLRIRMKQFADHFTAERPGSIFDVFASIGVALPAETQ